MLDAIHDPHVGTVYPLAHIAGLEPSVVGERLRRLFGLVPVAGEHRRVLRLDLAGLLVDPESDIGVRLADGAQFHPSRVVHRGNGRVLGHTVEFVDGNADADEELEHLRGDRSST